MVSSLSGAPYEAQRGVLLETPAQGAKAMDGAKKQEAVAVDNPKTQKSDEADADDANVNKDFDKGSEEEPTGPGEAADPGGTAVTLAAEPVGGQVNAPGNRSRARSKNPLKRKAADERSRSSRGEGVKGNGCKQGG